VNTTETQKHVGGSGQWQETHSVEAVVEQVFEVFAHADLSHQLVLVAVHARQLADVRKDVLKTVRQLQSLTYVNTPLCTQLPGTGTVTAQRMLCS